MELEKKEVVVVVEEEKGEEKEEKVEVEGEEKDEQGGRGRGDRNNNKNKKKKKKKKKGLCTPSKPKQMIRVEHVKESCQRPDDDFMLNAVCCSALNNRRELRSAARKWKKSKLDTDLISYRTLLSKFSLDVTSAKTSFYKEKLETSAQDPRKLYNIFLSLLNPPAPPSPSSLTAKDFATFYTEKIERICQTFTSLPTSPTSHSQHSATPSLTQLSTVAAEEVLQITQSCNPTTCPLDPISSAMLQTISPDLLPFITTVINGSLTSGHVPSAFKKARVIPILKKPALDPSDISNYRPESWNLWNSMGMVCFLPGWSLISDTTASARISACLEDISSWMTAHQLKLNPSKTELLIIPGLPLNAILPLQMIQNAAARLVFNLPKFSHTTPLLCSLHWLPVAARIRFKTLMLAYKAKNGPVPSYLKALITPRTAPRSLRSTSTARLVPPSLREKGTARQQQVITLDWISLEASCNISGIGFFKNLVQDLPLVLESINVFKNSQSGRTAS
ncbi:hypothetical protein QTP70_005951 [Hemibagrus guttatus]|uniref:Reverse transcriptase n=1 Tax=Hemibagrus guttatus TaxID=175788 RepID=A0AAE0V3P7_9TELE|nr:hypothetical protein QTP70_005951 [Hemibagrus guttatus]